MGNQRAGDKMEFGPQYRKVREELMRRLEGVDANILVSIVTQHGKRLPTQFFSDWPDSFSRDTWYKTWGKAESGYPEPDELLQDGIVET